MSLGFKVSADAPGLRLAARALANALLAVAMLAVTAIVAGLLAAGCSRQAPPANVPRPRIVSFSPALTNMIFGMGLGDHVVGVTGQCRLPDGLKRPVVGDSYSVNAEAIAAVEPDIVMIQQRAENFDAFKRIRPDVKIEHFDIETLEDVAVALGRIGKLAGDSKRGLDAAAKFCSRINSVRERAKNLPHPKVLFLIAYQYDKPGTGGRSSFIHEMIELAGGDDAAGNFSRWADLDAEAILAMRPDILIVWTKPGSENAATKYWTHLPGLTTPRDRIYVLSDPNWTIPSAQLADLADEMFDMIQPPDGATAPAIGATSQGAVK